MYGGIPADNERIGLFGPSRDGNLTIRGGASGISVQLEELTAGAEKLDALARDLIAVEQETGRVLDQLCLTDRQPPWSGSAHVVAVRNSQWGIQAVRADMQRTSSHIRACIRDYEDAEWRSKAGRFLGLTSTEEMGSSWRNMGGAGAMDGRTMETVVVLLGMTAPDVQARINKEPLVRDALMLLVANYIPRPLIVQQEESVKVELDSSPAGLLERVRHIDARGAGSIEVIEVDHGGEKAYVVVVPGTQPAGKYAGGDNPFDEAGIIEGMLYSSGEVNDAVLQALAAAGADRGAPVVAVGYSQGGIHAMNMAADSRFLDRYDVKYVLTAGSPVAGIAADEEVRSLHLEHEADWVPGADGAANAENRNRVTVSMATPLRSVEGEGGLGLGHGLTSYQEGARLVAASGDRSLMQSTAVLGSVLGAGGAATATRFSLSRLQVPSTQLDRRTPLNPRQQPGAK